jgi:WhiB family redox-sensing transcriptional regulator
MDDAASIIDEVTHRPPWQRQAACRGMGTADFFPVRGASTGPAKAICEGCKVRELCLAAALSDSATVGIWGGVSERGRRPMRKGAAA